MGQDSARNQESGDRHAADASRRSRAVELGIVYRAHRVVHKTRADQQGHPDSATRRRGHLSFVTLFPGGM